MSIADRRLWAEGKDLWYEYVNVNGYSFTYNNDGISKLARLLDLTPSYIKERIMVYLDN